MWPARLLFCLLFWFLRPRCRWRIIRTGSLKLSRGISAIVNPCRHNDLLDQDLLLFLELVDKLNGDLENLGYNLGWCESKPLRQWDVRDAVRFVDLDPDEVLVTCVLNVMAELNMLVVDLG